jgi:hypothetical protein
MFGSVIFLIGAFNMEILWQVWNMPQSQMTLLHIFIAMIEVLIMCGVGMFIAHLIDKYKKS